MHEVWDGKTWMEADPNVFTAFPIHSSANITNSSIQSTVTQKSDYNKENVYYFLKKHMRVAEYLDENGKVDYVQLEIREDEGCIWENIQRIRIKQ